MYNINYLYNYSFIFLFKSYGKYYIARARTSLARIRTRSHTPRTPPCPDNILVSVSK